MTNFATKFNNKADKSEFRNGYSDRKTDIKSLA